MVLIKHKIRSGEIRVPKGHETQVKRDEALANTLKEQLMGRDLESIIISRNAVVIHFKDSRIIFEYDENKVAFGNFNVSRGSQVSSSKFTVSYGDLPKEVAEHSSGTMHSELHGMDNHLIELNFKVFDSRFALAGVETLIFHDKGKYYQDHHVLSVTLAAKNTVSPKDAVEDYKVGALIGSSGHPVKITLQIGDNVKTYVLTD
ncbi:hypothetical protein HY988_00050 [Candidatus Micrarchaeota archaeon]|nr:hypothetical protein [Candidatus Micrarchaeota archaeon]